MKLFLVSRVTNTAINSISVTDDNKQSKREIYENAGYIVVESESAEIGWIYENNNLVPPKEEEINYSQVKHITKLAFRNRFTLEEKIAVEFAALDNPTASIEDRQKSATVRSYLKDLDSATYVDLDREDLKNSLQSLETLGLITAGRANEILTAKVNFNEIYTSK